MRFNTAEYLREINNSNFGKNILYIPKTKSTNEEMWEHFNSDHLVIVTDDQTSGRGRRENKWISQKFNSLTFSIGLIDHKNSSSLLALKSALATALAIQNTTGLNSLIKWPNDIMINNKKVGGILIESKLNRNQRILNIGIGINVNLNVNRIHKDIQSRVTSISKELRKKFKREIILAECVKLFDQYLYMNNKLIIEKWTELCYHVNSEIVFHHTDNNKVSGTFIGLDNNGRAKLNLNGKVKYFESGVIEI